MIERDHIAIVGKMNAGKSSVMNLLTQQATSIVDAKPGTTADTKLAVMELHGLGPVRLYDTAGIDEAGELGEKKRRKIHAQLKECDLVLFVIDPGTDDFAPERALLDVARSLEKQALILFNLFRAEDAARIDRVESAVPHLRFHARHTLRANDAAERPALLRFVLEHFRSKRIDVPLIPFCERDDLFVLNIPMDVETPEGRLLRPQSLAVEFLTRSWAYPVCTRMDLGAGRAADAGPRERERARWLALLNGLGRRPRCVITDSQAIDLVHAWTPPEIPVTTFSVMMINYVSRGRLPLFVEGLTTLAGLGAGERVLIVEACTHSRIGEDIGTVQIPRWLERTYPGVVIEHNFGREFLDNQALADYRLIVHCGGCMISPQTLEARVRDLSAVGVPLTNYGVLLAYAQGPAALRRVLEPWGLDRVL